MRLCAVCLALAAVLASGEAQAATVSVDVTRVEGKRDVQYHFAAAAGEANRVRATVRAPSGARRTVVFSDRGASITAKKGCALRGSGEAVCQGSFGDFGNSVDVSTGNGDDTVDARAVNLRGFTVFLDGGSGDDLLRGSPVRSNTLFGDFASSEGGDDRLIGGREADFLQGGAGDDLLDGRGGIDKASYRVHRRPVRVDLAAGTALSNRRERDRLRSVEQVEGGAGDDVLRGGPGRNLLQGLAGDDVLDGRAGDDVLVGNEGSDAKGPPDRDLLRGGPGRDALYGDAGPDHLVGESGADRLIGGLGVDLFDAGPGRDAVYAADRHGETVHCGPGRDRLRADRADRPASCEAVRLVKADAAAP
jgi:Ca2+-binding RTX toxin-like protein